MIGRSDGAGHAMFSRFTIYFDEVVRCGSIRGASQQLNISASAIDRQILNMEESIGAPLFERMPRGLRLTSAGEILIVHVRNWRRELKMAHAQIAGLQGNCRGEVTIGVAGGAAPAIIAQALAGFLGSNADISYHVSCVTLEDLRAMLDDGRADIGLVLGREAPAKLRVESSIVSQIGAVVRRDHALASLPEIRLARCYESGIIVPGTSMAQRGVLEDVWKRSIGEAITGVSSADSVELLRAMVLAGSGVGILTELDVRQDVDAGVLQFIPLADAKVPLSILSLVTPTRRILTSTSSVIVQQIVRFLLSVNQDRKS